MIDIKQITGFDWDKGNLAKNSASHQVEFYEAEEMFFNKPLLLQFDEGHSAFEDRYYALGKTNNSRKLFVVFTIRNSEIRVISARDMSRKERLVYEENT